MSPSKFIPKYQFPFHQMTASLQSKIEQERDGEQHLQELPFHYLEIANIILTKYYLQISYFVIIIPYLPQLS